MIEATRIYFKLDQGWGDFKNLWLIKYELGKSYNGFLEKGMIQWEEVQQGSEDIAKLTPFMKVMRNFPIQEMIDALTDEKKATEQIETLSELKATRYHLEDMRKLALKDLNK